MTLLFKERRRLQCLFLSCKWTQGRQPLALPAKTLRILWWTISPLTAMADAPSLPFRRCAEVYIKFKQQNYMIRSRNNMLMVVKFSHKPMWASFRVRLGSNVTQTPWWKCYTWPSTQPLTSSYLGTLQFWYICVLWRLCLKPLVLEEALGAVTNHQHLKSWAWKVVI